MKTVTLETRWWLTILGNNNDILKALKSSQFGARYLYSRRIIDTDDPDYVSAIMPIYINNELLVLCSLIEPLKDIPGTTINFYCNSTADGVGIHLRLPTGNVHDGNDELIIEETNSQCAGNPRPECIADLQSRLDAVAKWLPPWLEDRGHSRERTRLDDILKGKRE